MFNKEGIWTLDNVLGIPFRVDLLPETTKEVKETKAMNDPEFICIHNAGSKADDDTLNRYMKQDDYKIWHFTVDCDSITQGFSIKRTGWHAGDGRVGNGNIKSIGIEIADKGTDDERLMAVHNAFRLMYVLLQNDPDLIIKPHKFFSGKHCPMWILDHIGWDQFVKDYYVFSDSRKMIEAKATVAHWCDPIFERLTQSIQISEKRFDDPITRGEVFKLIDEVISHIDHAVDSVFK